MTYFNFAFFLNFFFFLFFFCLLIKNIIVNVIWDLDCFVVFFPLLKDSLKSHSSFKLEIFVLCLYLRHTLLIVCLFFILPVFLCFYKRKYGKEGDFLILQVTLLKTEPSLLRLLWEIVFMSWFHLFLYQNACNLDTSSWYVEMWFIST